MNEQILKRERRRELLITLSYTFFSVLMIVVTHIQSWPIIYIPVISVELAFIWWAYVTGFRSYTFRAAIVTTAICLNVFLYGIQGESFNVLIPTICTQFVLLSLYEIVRIFDQIIVVFDIDQIRIRSAPEGPAVLALLDQPDIQPVVQEIPDHFLIFADPLCKPVDQDYDAAGIFRLIALVIDGLSGDALKDPGLSCLLEEGKNLRVHGRSIVFRGEDLHNRIPPVSEGVSVPERSCLPAHFASIVFGIF